MAMVEGQPLLAVWSLLGLVWLVSQDAS